MNLPPPTLWRGRILREMVQGAGQPECRENRRTTLGLSDLNQTLILEDFVNQDSAGDESRRPQSKLRGMFLLKS